MREYKHSRTIGEHSYETMEVGALEGRAAFVRFAKLLAPLAEAGKIGSEKAIRELLESVSDTDMEYFCDLFAKRTTVQIGTNKPQLSGIFDDHFRGRYELMVEWLKFCFEVNFGSFLKKVQSGDLAALPKG